ncbi:formate dehydrogenase accessory sulfurtransferase FdhD [Lysobacter solisilvae (ex Woo and Kim 2020)]|uniref:Sulfur carrier protein FdhD n=1 Tax=Agrilutibacter terrestris TaxID=2865112 RepID=A0A7H0FTN0_9GAMM|nr:formate dehydrogenase accessory sulfurtransferase FdhD [Lysobacter terrestris]QNP39396.1 formate dehydrogenase accessory sulfurtransferase FdhD [Lysobacter terrestris]
MNDALASVQALRVQAQARVEREDAAVVETPVALLCNGAPFAVMMATPCDLEDFALGFALSEGVVADAGEFRLVDVVHGAAGIALHAAIPQARYDALQRRRTLEGRSGCGLCGVEALQDALRPVPRVREPQPVSYARIQAALAALAAQQPLNTRSGGVHAAGFVHAGGLLVREDVGRHNALDKVIGALVRDGLDPATGFLVITSRASYEIVYKAAVAGIGVVVAISAPTDLAIRTAQAAGITLAAFARGDAFNLYAYPQRVLAQD